MDGRRNNGGTKGNKGGGRKPKAEEERIVKLSTEAIIRVFKSEEKYWEHLAMESKESFAHLRLLSEYAYGKPKERTELELLNSTDSIVDRLLNIPDKQFNELYDRENQDL